jgi:nicotinamidase-related amidase
MTMKKSKKCYSRREFIKKSSFTGVGMGLSPGFIPPLFAQSPPQMLNIKPRYHRWHVDPGEEWVETNTGYATLDWQIPLSQTALVLLDVWQRHYIKDTEERGERVINDNLIPLVEKCRQSGMQIIHAPSPPVAKRHPNWVKLVSEDEMMAKTDDWPPQQFRSLSGPYKNYRRPVEPREAERQSLPILDFHPKVQPVANEPVIATGEELHRYCKQEGILFLFFAGFNTNACILSRDYGTIHMSNRGYEVILVRDCTTGMESAETHATLAQTNNAILQLEMFGQYSVASGEIMNGFSSI